MRLFWLYLFLIVVIDPYADIKYGEIDVYEYTEPSEKQPKRKRKYRSKYRKKKHSRIWCSMCNPARWIYL